MNNNIRIGNLFGIPFYVNPSWFIVLGLITLTYSGQLALVFPELGALAWVLGLAAALMLFASVLAHELGHSVVAISQGIEVNSITLFIFGGLASLGEESKTPGDAFKVAIAGPLVSFLLFGIFSLVGAVVPLPGPFQAIVGLLAYINLALGVFNLIPGLPLDGGNVLKALVWKITGKPYKGIAFASIVGQFFGWVGILLGIASILNLTSFGSFWTLLIGWFLLQNAGRSAQSAAIQEKMSGYTALDAIYADSPVTKGSQSLRELANNYIIGSQRDWRKFLVTNEDGQLVGEIDVDALKTIPTNDWWSVTVDQLTHPIEALTTIPAKMPLLEALGLFQDDHAGVVVVVNDDNQVLGLLERDSIFQMLQRQEEGDASEEAIALNAPSDAPRDSSI
ncbi:MAG: site-2 protease family protein [Leptolyngbya sp. DLM2.Bin15]|nr:MAG: site-2 protease family protein [Leptolyngbya sp. DLM2.Bin15]